MSERFRAKHDGADFEIEEDPALGFYVYRYVGGICTHDHLQDDLPMAKRCAFEEFGVPVDAWVVIEAK